MADLQIKAMDGKREFGVEFRRDEGLWSDGSVCSQGVNCTEMMWYDLESSPQGINAELACKSSSELKVCS